METQKVESTRSTWVAVAVAVVFGLVLGAIGVVVFWPEDSSAAAVTLQRADAPGDDPFTDSVQTGAVPVIEQPAVQAASAVRADLPHEVKTSVLVATGTAPGLYGGTGDAHVCDAAKLVSYLHDHPDKAQAFSSVLGITPEGIWRLCRHADAGGAVVGHGGDESWVQERSCHHVDVGVAGGHGGDGRSAGCAAGEVQLR